MGRKNSMQLTCLTKNDRNLKEKPKISSHARMGLKNLLLN